MPVSAALCLPAGAVAENPEDEAKDKAEEIQAALQGFVAAFNWTESPGQHVANGLDLFHDLWEIGGLPPIRDARFCLDFEGGFPEFPGLGGTEDGYILSFPGYGAEQTVEQGNYYIRTDGQSQLSCDGDGIGHDAAFPLVIVAQCKAPAVCL